jgi:uracil-DNA glycosylase
MIDAENYNIHNWENIFGDNVDISCIPIEKSWKDYISKFGERAKFGRINKQLTGDIKNGCDIYPYPILLYEAFNQIKFGDIKVVFIGQDPYINAEYKNNVKVPQATGLAFSVPIGVKIPPSLHNIFSNQIKYNVIDKQPKHGNLNLWASQGCLMINSSLTVKENESNSHKQLWSQITDNIIKNISNELNDIMFVLWGNDAYQKRNIIDFDKHYATISSHPSGLSCSKPLKSYNPFCDTDHFNIINQHLEDLGEKRINWNMFV